MDFWDGDARITQMVRLIEREAAERVSAIASETQQLVERERNRVFKEGREQALEEVQRRREAAKLAQRLEKSRKITETRLDIQRQREELLNRLRERVAEQLIAIVADRQRYEPLFASLVLDALAQLNEDCVLLVVREEDRMLAKESLPNIRESYKDFLVKKGRNDIAVVLKIVDGRSLDKNEIGGVSLFCDKGKIFLRNTLKARLELAFSECAPQIRARLFAPPQSSLSRL